MSSKKVRKLEEEDPLSSSHPLLRQDPPPPPPSGDNCHQSHRLSSLPPPILLCGRYHFSPFSSPSSFLVGRRRGKGRKDVPGRFCSPTREPRQEKKSLGSSSLPPFSLHYCFLLHGTVILPSKLKSARSQHIRRTELGLSSSTHTAPVLINGWLGKSILGCRSSLLSFLSKELRYPFPFPISRDTTFWAIYRKSAAAKDKNGDCKRGPSFPFGREMIGRPTIVRLLGRVSVYSASCDCLLHFKQNIFCSKAETFLLHCF